MTNALFILRYKKNNVVINRAKVRLVNKTNQFV